MLYFFGSDKILINGRNVVTEVKKNYAACRQFSEVELDARIVAAALVELSISHVDDTPTDADPPTDVFQTKISRKKFLKTFSERIVDKYLLKADQLDDFLKTKHLQSQVDIRT